MIRFVYISVPVLQSMHTWMGLFENVTEPTQLKVCFLYAHEGSLLLWEDRSPSSGGVGWATGTWGHQNYVRNRADRPCGNCTTLLRGVQRTYFQVCRFSWSFISPYQFLTRTTIYPSRCARRRCSKPSWVGLQTHPRSQIHIIDAGRKCAARYLMCSPLFIFG